MFNYPDGFLSLDSELLAVVKSMSRVSKWFKAKRGAMPTEPLSRGIYPYPPKYCKYSTSDLCWLVRTRIVSASCLIEDSL